MRTHEFADNFDATLFKPNAIVLRLRYYLRERATTVLHRHKRGSGARAELSSFDDWQAVEALAQPSLSYL
ncbi:MAG: hypothetical protein IPO38_10525 [Rhodocyclaceae bacterium]|nr:hypothetical protein [Rhodocyclaceae bacterium]